MLSRCSSSLVVRTPWYRAATSNVFKRTRSKHSVAGQKFAKANDECRIAYRVHAGTNASRTPLLLVGGWAMTKNDWGNEFVDHLRTDRSVITFDHRGIGDSDCPPGPYTTFSDVTDLYINVLQIMEEVEEKCDCGVSSAAVLGVSMGGMISQAIFKANPDIISALILGCTTHGGKEAYAPAREFFGSFQGWDTAEVTEKQTIARRVLTDMLGAWAKEHQEQLATMVQSYIHEHRSLSGINSQLAALGKFNSTSYLNEIHVPTLVIHGDSDGVVPEGNGRLLSEKIPGAQSIVLPGCGHMWWVSAAETSAAVIANFLQDNAI